MIGLDTNILLRYITNDDAAQAKAAEALIASRCSREQPGFISTSVLVELLWSLSSGYGYSRDDLQKVMSELIEAQEFRLEQFDLVVEAFTDWQSSSAGYTDILLGLINAQNGCETTYTFDRRASALPTFTLLG